MTQNTSSAVMARRVEPHDSLEDFPTPPWATRALIQELGLPRDKTVWEPACNRGYMARPLREHFARVYASDIHDYGWDDQEMVVDFLFPGDTPQVDWIVTNPPFRLATQFAHRAFGIAREGVALFVRTAFLEGAERWGTLFRPYRPTAVLQFVERVPIHKGTITATGSTATAYCWVIWRAPYDEDCPAVIDWIPPCRKRLERPGDYMGTAL